MDKKTTRKPRAKKTAKKRPAGFAGRHSLSLLIAAIALLFVVCGVASFALQRHSGEPRWVEVNDEMTPTALRDTLRSRLGGIMGYKTWILWKLQGGEIKDSRGAYRIDKGMTAVRFARNIAKGRQTPVNVTFNNIRTMNQLAERVTSRLAMTPESFLAAADSVLSAKGFNPAQYPAAFLPDTYECYGNISPTALVTKLYDHRANFWTPERIAAAERLGLTPVEIATVASIVEEESAKPDEYGKIARLYLNRIKKGMKLQADPTVKYALGDFSIRRISGPMLSTESPYNTYRVTGLPPGPIRIVQGSTIDTVLNAPSHDYLYMCAREDFSGYHNFAVDYTTHRANAARYQAALDRRGIR